MKINKINISKKIIRSPTKFNNLSKELKNKLKQDSPASETKVTSFKKIKISPKKYKSKKNHLFIPTSLSNKPTEVTKDVVVDKLIETINKPDAEAKNSVASKDSTEDTKSIEHKTPEAGYKEPSSTIKKNKKKLSKSKKISRKKKSAKSKTISINLNNGKVEKEKDIIEIINKFEKMDIKEI